MKSNLRGLTAGTCSCISLTWERRLAKVTAHYLRGMNRLIYIDTSVVGGYFDEEFAKDTVPFFDAIRAGEGTLVVSDLLVAELS